MPRIRTIKPEFWTDERIGELSIPARLMFIGLWNYADDEGRFEVSPKKLKIWIFPYDEISAEEVWNYFEELLATGLVIEYEIEGRIYYCIKNFKKHQRINRPSHSKLPPPPEISKQFSENSVNTHTQFSEYSVNTHGELNEDSLTEKEKEREKEREREMEITCNNTNTNIDANNKNNNIALNQVREKNNNISNFSPVLSKIQVWFKWAKDYLGFKRKIVREKERLLLAEIWDELYQEIHDHDEIEKLLQKAWIVFVETGKNGKGFWADLIRKNQFKFRLFLNNIDTFVDAVENGVKILTEKKEKSTDSSDDLSDWTKLDPNEPF
mgnify:CR=1 FL=1